LASGLDEPDIKTDDNIDVGQFLVKVSEIVAGVN
jgi:hypothetical protein